MTEKEVKLVVGGLLHDIGKVIYRSGDGRNHSKSGYDFLREELAIDDKDILESVLYHHGSAVKNADINEKSFAYITYIADNIASASDRRKRQGDDYGFEMSSPLEPVFNILNGNNKKMYYEPMVLDENINYPIEDKKKFTESYYQQVKLAFKDAMKGIDYSKEYVNSILAVLEKYLSYVPSSTSRAEIADISLYDHVKLTAALNSCIYQYAKSNGIENYKNEMFEKAEQFYAKDVFLLYEADLSGIQDFIYTIPSKGALKNLRSRSFYLEILMEHILDELLARVNLSRANILYQGGGHCYLILPNTDEVKQIVDDYSAELKQWFLDEFDTSLYIATAYVTASSNNFKNEPQGSYGDLFRNLSKLLGIQKSTRYDATDILKLNSKKIDSYTKECKVCKRLAKTNEEDECAFCESITNMSKAILYEQFFVVVTNCSEGISLPGNMKLVAESEEQLRNRMINNKDSFVRAYSKNKFYTGLNIANRIWVGNYTTGKTFDDLADASEGIKKFGVLRADVDNLGQTFVGGFEEQYSTISRTATLSRQLSIFFKYYINSILENGQCKIGDLHNVKRNASIVYSGGDDLFIVGAWNEIIEIAVDIRNEFLKYTENTLSISAGIGMFGVGYPIHRIAYEVGEQEDDAKRNPNKNSVNILPDGEEHEIDNESYSISDGTYSWEEFTNNVIGEKYRTIKNFFDTSEERGKNFMYNLLSLLRGRDEKINYARYIYTLSRLEPKANADIEQKQAYSVFSNAMYKWIKSEKDTRELKTAINLYAYLNREREE